MELRRVFDESAFNRVRVGYGDGSDNLGMHRRPWRQFNRDWRRECHGGDNSWESVHCSQSSEMIWGHIPAVSAALLRELGFIGRIGSLPLFLATSCDYWLNFLGSPLALRYGAHHFHACVFHQHLQSNFSSLAATNPIGSTTLSFNLTRAHEKYWNWELAMTLISLNASFDVAIDQIPLTWSWYRL